MSLKKLNPRYLWRKLRENLPGSARHKPRRGYAVPVSRGRAARLGDVLRLDDTSPGVRLAGWPVFFGQVQRNFLDILSGAGQAWPLTRSALGPAAVQRDALALAAYPGVAMTEDGSHYLASFEVPGLELDDLSVKVQDKLQDKLLVIEGHAARSAEHHNDNYYRFVRSVEAFSRSFALPPDADGGQIEASVIDNVLTVAIARR